MILTIKMHANPLTVEEKHNCTKIYESLRWFMNEKCRDRIKVYFYVRSESDSCENLLIVNRNNQFKKTIAQNLCF